VSRSHFDLHRIGAGLPVAAARDELERAIDHGAVIVTAPPGTGKTTFVPPLVANHVDGRVLLTQPRRIAVRAAAHRIAQLDGGSVGGAVGFTIRGERRLGPNTRLEVLTPGVLLRRLMTDPELRGVGAVVLDEVHERSVDGDLLLGMLAEVRELREDLTVIAMSATLDAELLAGVLGADASPAEIVRVPAALHPLHIDYQAFDGARLSERGVTREYLTFISEVAAVAQAKEQCDALLFLPSVRDVDAAVRHLRERVASGVEVLPLHGRISGRDQDRIVRGRAGGGTSRLVVSTALAESSLTVPGVRLVVDSGLSREVRRDRARDMTGLVTVSASRASAEQRAGRAAREGPGRAIRVYSEADAARMPAASAPEITAADLVDAALLFAAWGTPGGRGLALPTPPPQAAIEQAEQVLHALGLVDDNGGVTVAGREIAALPVGVRDARALQAGARDLGAPRLAAEVVAAVSGDSRDPGADLGRLLRALRSGTAPGAERWRREVQRLTRILDTPGEATNSRDELTARNSAAPGIVTAFGRPERLARRTGARSRTYQLAGGTRAALPESSGLVAEEWLAISEVQRAEGRAADGTGAVIRLAAPISEHDARRIGAPLITHHRLARVDGGRVRVRLEERLGAIVVTARPTAPTAADAGPAFTQHLAEVGLEALRWSDAAVSLRARLDLLHRTLGDPWPATDDEALLSRAPEWLWPDLESLGAAGSLRDLDVLAALRRLLPWPEAGRFDELAPERLEVPSGAAIRVDYPAAGTPDSRPVIAVKLQEVFGLAQTPRLVDGRVPVLFHLLSPARKPLAITDDLASFWNGPYREVRKEMRGRYPKHPWPEDPWTATATARTKRRG